MPKTVIVPLDGSAFAERALAPAVVLARQAHATPVLVMSRVGGPPDPESYLFAKASATGISGARTEVFDDRLAAAAIVTLAEQVPDPIVCMATHARSWAGTAVFGSVAQEVVDRVDTPVVVVGPSANPVDVTPFEEIAVCLDGSPLADAMLPVAMVLARDLDLGVWLMTVVDSDAPSPEKIAAGEDVSETARLQHLAHDLASTGVSVNWDVLHGRDAAAAVVDFVRTRPSPLLALTTHGRSGLSRLTAGSVAMAIVHHAPCPVLVIRSR